jgi:hypothetical protein
LAENLLPDHRVVARFDFPDQPEKANRLWFIFNADRSEVCRAAPGFDEALIITADATALTLWHLGRIEWSDAIRSGRIRVSGPPRLARALPTWNRRSGWAHIEGVRRAKQPQAHSVDARQDLKNGQPPRDSDTR